MHRYVVLFVVSMVLLVGCRGQQTVKDAWKGTRSYYYQYLNTPAKLNMADKGDVEDYQVALGVAVSDFDFQLEDLERVLYNSDRNPDAAWVSQLTARFPWLSGVALTDELGIPRAQIPADYPKPFEIGTLIEVDPKQQLKDLRAHLQTDPLGPEIYVGNPVYIGDEFRGVITVHFDPRALLIRTGDPARIVLASPKGVIWPAMYDIQATPLAAIDWDRELRRRSSGVVSNDLGSFYWVSRYLGNLPLVYAIRIKGEFPIIEDQLRDLSQANAFAMGPVNFADIAPPEEQAGPGEEPVEITPDGGNSPLAPPSAAGQEQLGTPLSQ